MRKIMLAAVASVSLFAVPAVAQVYIEGPGVHVGRGGVDVRGEYDRRDYRGGRSDGEYRGRSNRDYRARAERCRIVETREVRPSGRVVITREERCR